MVALIAAAARALRGCLVLVGVDMFWFTPQ
jgi:hypothetical protein